MKMKVEMVLDVDASKAEELKKLEHHAEWLLDLDSWPEIKSVSGLKVKILPPDPVDWAEKVTSRLKFASEHDEDELDVFMGLVDEGFKLEYLPKDHAQYSYVSFFMKEHGLA